MRRAIGFLFTCFLTLSNSSGMEQQPQEQEFNSNTNDNNSCLVTQKRDHECGFVSLFNMISSTGIIQNLKYMQDVFDLYGENPDYLIFKGKTQEKELPKVGPTVDSLVDIGNNLWKTHANGSKDRFFAENHDEFDVFISSVIGHLEQGKEVIVLLQKQDGIVGKDFPLIKQKVDFMPALASVMDNVEKMVKNPLHYVRVVAISDSEEKKFLVIDTDNQAFESDLSSCRVEILQEINNVSDFISSPLWQQLKPLLGMFGGVEISTAKVEKIRTLKSYNLITYK